MSALQPQAHSDRRAEAVEEHRAERKRARSGELQAQQRRRHRVRTAAFGIVVATVLAVGGYLAFGDFAGQRDVATAADAIPVRLSMAGFTPSEIRVPAGKPVTLELWTTDAAPHLQGGVHTMISEDLGIYEELPAAGPTGESRKVVTITAPMKAGTYDIYCDTCCGGKDSPTMHGSLTVEA